MNTAHDPVPLTSDVVFKYIFGNAGSENILRAFLSAVQTDAGFPAVAEVRIENPFNLQDFSDDKLSVVDVRAIDVNGVAYTIEIQATRQQAFLQRALYYWARTYYRQLTTTDTYDRLCPAVGVNILDYTMYRDRPHAHTAFVLTALDDPALRMTDNLVIHTIELPKTGKPSTSLDRWSYYLKQRGSKNAMDDLILLKTMRDDPEIEDAEARYREFLANPELEERYLARQKFLRDQATYRKEAREEGLEEGRQEGRRIGLQEGRREEAVQIARRMRTRGMDESIVADVTGLTMEEIRGL